MLEPLDILGLTSASFVERAASRRVTRPAALDAYHAVFRRGAPPVDFARLPEMPVTRRQDDRGTLKFTQRLESRHETETVIIPYTSRAGRPRTTLCVSSQVGCAMGCTFCETARMGLLGNLTAAQIVGQWHAARFELGASIDNIVFMGMGEPMDNLDAVIDSIRVFADANGPALAASRLTVSTVGRTAGIRRLATLADEPGFGRLGLAVSINAPNDDIRSEIMPVNRAEPLSELIAAMHRWTDGTRRRVLVEYVLIPGVNDQPRHADQLAARLGPLPCTVNVIPYNPRRDSPWPAPADTTVDAFVRNLVASGHRVTRRRTTGRSVMAACGQLGNEAVRRRRPVAR